eukprot:4842673-Alexandrium_andersonii.AAC.1
MHQVLLLGVQEGDRDVHVPRHAAEVEGVHVDEAPAGSRRSRAERVVAHVALGLEVLHDQPGPHEVAAVV